MLWNALDQCRNISVTEAIDGDTLAKMLTVLILPGKGKTLKSNTPATVFLPFVRRDNGHAEHGRRWR